MLLSQLLPPLCASTSPPSPHTLHMHYLYSFKKFHEKKTEARNLNGWGWVLESVLISLATNRKKSLLYTMLYSGAIFLKKKSYKSIKLNNKLITFYKKLKFNYLINKKVIKSDLFNKKIYIKAFSITKY